jgi:AcrR family transcriptional regulator
VGNAVVNAKVNAGGARQRRTLREMTIVPIAGRGEANQFPQRARAREVILNAALRLYGREGYNAVTMRALGLEIGCSAASIYTYFLDKNELFAVLQEQGLRLFADALVVAPMGDPVADLRAFFRRYYDFSKTNPEYFTLLWADHSVPTFNTALPDVRAVYGAGHTLAQRCIEEGIFPAGTSTATVTQILWSSVHGPAVLHSLPRFERTVDADNLVESALDLTLAGLRAGLLVSAVPPKRGKAR